MFEWVFLNHHADCREMFGEECVEFTEDKNVSVTVDGRTILISLVTRVRSRTGCWCGITVGLCSFKDFSLVSS